MTIAVRGGSSPETVRRVLSPAPGVISVCSSAGMALRPCMLTVAHVPGTGVRCWVRNSPDGSASPTMPSATIWKQPTSSEGP